MDWIRFKSPPTYKNSLGESMHLASEFCNQGNVCNCVIHNRCDYFIQVLHYQTCNVLVMSIDLTNINTNNKMVTKRKPSFLCQTQTFFQFNLHSQQEGRS